MKLHTARMITCDVQNCVQELTIPCWIYKREDDVISAGSDESETEVDWIGYEKCNLWYHQNCMEQKGLGHALFVQKVLTQTYLENNDEQISYGPTSREFV